MNTELEFCPNCGVKLKPTPFSKISLSQPIHIKLINEYTELKSEIYCEKCGRSPYAKAFQAYHQEKNNIESELKSKIPVIPIISSQAPYNWEYQIFDLITAQSVTGTGVISEIASSFSDLFGKQSSALNSKLKEGENLCFAQLRKKALEIGANAIIATDIDYAEVGTTKGMLMVCVSGTAINITNTEVLGIQRQQQIQELIKIYDRNNYLNTLSNAPQYL